MIVHLLIIAIGIAGFSLSLYINRKKRHKKKMVCPVGASCDTVIQSEYSKFFGVPVELIGMAYYALAIIYYVASFMVGGFIPTIITFLVFATTLLAFLFSAYLTGIQAFILKNWCSWCLMSAGFCTIIFSLAIFALPNGLVNFLNEIYDIVWSLHLLAITFGVGGATVSAVLFMKFLKDLRISHMEARVLRIISDVIWTGIIMFTITTVGLYLPDLLDNQVSGELFVQFVVWAVIVANAFLLYLFISPRLKRISYGQEHDHRKGELKEIHKFAFALGSVSVVSWYFLFFVVVIEYLPFSIVATLLLYFGLLMVGLIISQVAEGYFRGKRNN